MHVSDIGLGHFGDVPLGDLRAGFQPRGTSSRNLLSLAPWMKLIDQVAGERFGGARGSGRSGPASALPCNYEATLRHAAPPVRSSPFGSCSSSETLAAPRLRSILAQSVHPKHQLRVAVGMIYAPMSSAFAFRPPLRS